MPPRLRSLALAVALACSVGGLGTSGCVLTDQVLVRPTGTPRPTAQGALVTGTVTAPAGVAPADAKAFRSLQADAAASAGAGAAKSSTGAAKGKAPLAGAEVFLGDAAGNPIPNLPTVKTDGQGRYKIPNVPEGFTFVVVVRVKSKDGKPGELQTLVKSAKLGATADVSLASTMLTLASVEGKKGSLGDFDPVTFRNGVDATAKRVEGDDAIDVADKNGLKHKMEALAAEVGEIKASLDELKKDLAQIRASVDDLQAQIDALKKQQPGGTPSPSPSAEATPGQVATLPLPVETPMPSPSADGTPGPSAQPSALPSGAATPVPHASSGPGKPAGANGDVATFALPASPYSLTIDPSGQVWVALGEAKLVLKLAPADGQVLAKIPTTGTPYAVAADAQGNVWVSMSGSNGLIKLKSDGSLALTASGYWGSGYQLAVNGAGEVWTTNYSSLAKISPTGMSLPGASGQSLSGLMGVALDPQGTPWATSGAGATTPGKVYKFQPNGQVVATYAAGLDPFAIACDPQGNAWVANARSNNVTEISASGEIKGPFAVGTTPRAIAVDGAGQVWVANTDANTVTKLSPAGELLATYSVGSQPGAIAISADGAVWVANRTGNSLSRIK